MGSKTTPSRKQKDISYIPTPTRDYLDKEILPTDSTQDRIAQLCEIAFQVKIPSSPIAKPGVKVSLKKIHSLYYVFIGGNELTGLSPEQSTMIDTCARINVHYIGKIAVEKSKLYARFTRIAQ